MKIMTSRRSLKKSDNSLVKIDTGLLQSDKEILSGDRDLMSGYKSLKECDGGLKQSDTGIMMKLSEKMEFGRGDELPVKRHPHDHIIIGGFMNKRQENKFTMYEGIFTFLRTNTETVNSVPMLKDSVDEFSSVIVALRLKSTEVSNTSTGKTAVKSQAEDDLVSILLPVAAGLFVFAKKQNNVELKEKAKLTESHLRTIRDTELASKGDMIATLAIGQVDNLVRAGVTEEMIADLNAKVQAYRSALGARESSVAERMGARTTMEDLFAKVDGILEEEIDPAMELIRTSKTQFYNEYFALRVIKDMGVRHRPEQTPVPVSATTK
jgi:hypothetical protein